MSRVLPLTLLACVALSALAAPAMADSITVTGLPASAPANGTVASLPFKVSVVVDMGHCAGGTSQDFTVTLAAKLNNTAGPGIGADVSPKTFSVSIQPTDTVQSDKTYTQDFTLTVHAEGLTTPVNATAVVTATASDVRCSVPVATAPTFAEGKGTSAILFKPSGNIVTGDQNTDQPVPGLGLPLAALGLVGVAMLRRRK